MYPDVAGITLDVILISLITYETVQTWHMVRSPNFRIAVSSSLLNGTDLQRMEQKMTLNKSEKLIEKFMHLEGSLDWERTVRPVVSMRWITRWSRTILRLARSCMLNSETIFC